MKPLLDGQPVQPLPPTDPRYTEGGAESKVPDVVGRGQNDARSILEKAGWKVSTRTVDNRADKGTVVGQTPTAPPCRGDDPAADQQRRCPRPPAAGRVRRHGRWTRRQRRQRWQPVVLSGPVTRLLRPCSRATEGPRSRARDRW